MRPIYPLAAVIVIAALVAALYLGYSQQAQQNSNATASQYAHTSMPVLQTTTIPQLSPYGGVSLSYNFTVWFANASASQQTAAIDEMTADHVGWIRLQAGPDNVTSLIKDAVAAGINVDVQVMPDGELPTPSNMVNVSMKAVEEDGPLGVNVYEIMNEPNTHSYGLPGNYMPAANYTAVLKASYTKIKSMDPDAIVLVGGLAPTCGSPENCGSNPQGQINYLEAMYSNGSKGYFDAMNMHPYSGSGLCNLNKSWNACYWLPSLYNVMVANGDGSKKIWITEYGCPTSIAAGGAPEAYCNATTEGDEILAAYEERANWSWAGPMLVYEWIDSAKCCDGDFGLYYQNGTPKEPALSDYINAVSNYS